MRVFGHLNSGLGRSTGIGHWSPEKSKILGAATDMKQATDHKTFLGLSSIG